MVKETNLHRPVSRANRLISTTVSEVDVMGDKQPQLHTTTAYVPTLP